MNRNRTNPVKSLRQPGVKGQVQLNRSKSLMIVNRKNVTMECWAAELLPGVWDYGILYITVDGTRTSRREKKPGEGSGWFRSENDALLYGLYELRAHTEPGTTLDQALHYELRKLTSASLFD